MTNAKIRHADEADIEALSRLKLVSFRETFLEGFGIPYPPADLAQFEREKYGRSRIAAELADPDHRTWVVEDGGRLVAYAHVGPCGLPHAEVRDGDMEIYQIYLLRDQQGAGLGKRLLSHALTYLEEFGVPVWLGVWSGNHKAAALYRSLGFVRVGEYQFAVGTWLDDEHIYRRPSHLPL